MKKLIAIIILSFSASGILVACGDHQSVACASVIEKGSSGGGGGGKSSGGGSSSGKSSSGSPSGKSSSGQGAAKGPAAASGKTSSGAVSGPVKGSKPAAGDVAVAKSEAPSRVTRGGSYTSSVTNRTYIFHSGGGYGGYGYYLSPGYMVDYYDPYNPYNYWSFPLSPFYGRPYVVAEGCDGDDHEDPKQNVNITVDIDGKVVAADDSSTPGTVVVKDGSTTIPLR